MDWTKAKTILIVAFLVTNLFLGASLLRMPLRQEVSAVNETYLEQTLQFLEDQGVRLETELPRHTPSLAPITVEYRFFPPRETARRMLGEEWEMEMTNTFRSERGRLRVTNEQHIVFQPRHPNRELPNTNEATLSEVSEAFLREYDLFPEGLVLTQIYVGTVLEYHEEPLHKLVYEQTYRGRFMGESHVNVFLNQQGVVAVEALLLENPDDSQQAGAQRTMIDAPEAILRKLDEILQHHRGNGPLVVSRIEPGHYFALQRDAMGRWEPVASGTAVPAWKIVLKNGDTFYQEAF